MGDPGRWRPALLAGVAAFAVLAAVLFVALRNDRPVAPPVGVVGAGAPAHWPVWGFTHTDISADLGPASETARRGIARQRVLQNQHIMGWGAGNPEPSPGRYDFAALDRRIAYLRSTGGLPVITLCCAPDWMKGGRPGRTDWRRLEVAPTPDHFGDFARLAAVVARRYPDVRHFSVWNELKGFFDERTDNWAYRDYTNLYNQVYDALKAVNPQIKVGGPYVPMYSFVREEHTSVVRGPWGSVDQRALDTVDHWLRYKHGADFITVDGPTASDDRDVYPDEITALGKFAAINRWLRSRTSLPIWWNEYYVEPERLPWSESRRIAVNAAALIEMAKSGAATVLYWDNAAPDRRCQGCLWISSLVPGGGAPGRMLDLVQAFARWFPAGTRLVALRAGDPSVRVLAQRRRAVAVNVTGARVRTEIGGGPLTLAPYEVRWLDR